MITVTTHRRTDEATIETNLTFSFGDMVDFLVERGYTVVPETRTYKIPNDVYDCKADFEAFHVYKDGKECYPYKGYGLPSSNYHSVRFTFEVEFNHALKNLLMLALREGI